MRLALAVVLVCADGQRRRVAGERQDLADATGSDAWPGLLMRKKLLAAPTPMPTAHKRTPAPCVDVPPDSRFTCAQQRRWGKCGEPWMWGFCCKSCHGCRDECTTRPAPAPTRRPALGARPDLPASSPQPSLWGRMTALWHRKTDEKFATPPPRRRRRRRGVPARRHVELY